MKSLIINFVLFLILIPLAQAQEQNAVDKKPLDASFLREYAETRGFMLGRPVKPKFTPDGKSVLFLRSEPKKSKLSLFEFDTTTQKTKELLTPETVLKGAEENLTPEEKARRERMRLSAGGFSDYQLTEDGKKILLPLSGKLYVFERENNKVRELATGKGTLLDPKLSPDGNKVGYVLNYDVFVYDLDTNKETQVTQGGTPVKTNGLAEFVAQEEMARFSGYWWSPDSKTIAYEEVDHEGVEQWFVADSTKPEQPPLPQYYPRPGKKNVSVRLGLIPISGGTTTWIDWDRKKYEYLASVKWDKEGPLTIQLQDRKQQILSLLSVDPKNGQTKQLIEEKDLAFLNLYQDFPKWLPNERGFLWPRETATGISLLRVNANGTGSIEVLKDRPGFKGVPFSDSTGIVYQDREDESDPSTQSIYWLFTSEMDKGVKGMPISDKKGIHSGTFGKTPSNLLITSTNSEQLPKTYWINPTTSANKVEIPSVAIEPNFVPEVQFDKFGEFYTAIIRPQNFDPKKKYPVIVDVYGGPHHLHVMNAMRNWLLPQWLADQGFIIVAIDNKGTPARGRDWERAIYQKFGSVPLEGQVEGLQALSKKYPEMDLEKVGIVGWSFGGYMSALAVLKRPDVFKAAVAGAPVTDWEDYDTHYTERYMGILPESKKAYEESSLLPLASKLERPLLLVHGTADDNVYFRHTLRLTDALFRAGKDFEVLPLPSLTHMVPDPIVTERLWTRIAKHFQKHLK